jgi:hypothetical protein
MDWQSLLSQIKARHEVLHNIQDDIGSSYADRTARNQALSNAIVDAIDGQVAKVNQEKDSIVQECRDYILKSVNMRKAMGERHSVDGTSVNHIEIQKVLYSLNCRAHYTVASRSDPATTQTGTSLGGDRI